MENQLKLNNLSELANATKSTLSEYVKAITEPVFEGEESALNMYIKFKKFELLVKEAIEKLKANAITEAGRYSAADSKLLGAKFSIKKGGEIPEYSYDHIEPYFELLTQKNELLRQIETIDRLMEVVVDCANKGTAYPPTGEVLEKPIRVGSKTTSDILTVTINP